MKSTTFIALILILFSSCNKQVPQFELTFEEHSITQRNLQIVDYKRNGNLILRSYIQSNTCSRLIYLNGQCILMETDENRDGFSERITLIGDTDLYDCKFEIFLRQTNGTVVPLDGDHLENEYTRILEHIRSLTN